MEQDISEEEKEALEAEHRIDQKVLKALLWVVENSRDTYESDRSALDSAIRQLDSSSPVLYETINHFTSKLSDPVYSDDYGNALQTIRNQIDS